MEGAARSHVSINLLTCILAQVEYRSSAAVHGCTCACPVSLARAMSRNGAATCKARACQESASRVGKTISQQSPALECKTPAAIKSDILQWDSVLDCICDEVVHIQALRPVCSQCATAATADVLCHLAFHDKGGLMLDPFADPLLPIWSRCIAVL